MKAIIKILLIGLTISLNSVEYAVSATKTWSGNTNTDWNNSGNWVGGIVADSSDNVVINSNAPNNLILTQNQKITNLTINGDTLDLGGYRFEITGTAYFNGGLVKNGLLKPTGSLCHFGGATLDARIEATCGYFHMNSGVYKKPVFLTSTGAATSSSTYGNHFEDSLTIINNGAVYFNMGSSGEDIYDGPVILYNYSSKEIRLAATDTSYFNNSIYINDSLGGVEFGVSGGVSILASGKTISIGTFSSNYLTLNKFIQLGSTSQTLTLSGTGVVSLEGCIFNGNLTINSPGILTKNSTYNGNTTFNRTGSTTNFHSYGGNVFAGSSFTLDNAGSGGRIRFASTAPDTYMGDATFSSTGGQDLQVAYVGDNTFAGNITINSNKVVFNTSTGKVTFTGSSAQSLNGSYNFLFEKLAISKSANNVTANTILSVDDTLFFVSGNIITNATNHLIMKAGAKYVGESNSSFVQGAILKIGNSSFKFPLGGKGILHPIGITAPSNSSDAFLAFYDTSLISTGEKDSTLFQLLGYGSWNISRTSGSSNVKIIGYWGSYNSVYYPSLTNLCQFDGTQWVNLGSSSNTGNRSAGSTTTQNNLSTFGDFILAIENGLPPAEICGSGDPVPELYLPFNDDATTSGSSIGSEHFDLGSASVISGQTMINYDTGIHSIPILPSTNNKFYFDRCVNDNATSSNIYKSQGTLINNHSTVVNDLPGYFAVEMHFILNKSEFSNKRQMDFFRFLMPNSTDPTIHSAFITENSIVFRTNNDSPEPSNFPEDDFVVMLDGENQLSLSYYLDEDWHHIAFIHRFDGAQYVKEIYIDGELYSNHFRKELPTTYRLQTQGIGTSATAGNIEISGVALFDRYCGARDNIAFYFNNELCPDAIENHATEINQYVISTSAGTTNIPNTSSLAGTLNAVDFPLGYTPQSTFATVNNDIISVSNINNYNDLYDDVSEPTDQLRTYATPRFKPGHGFQPNVNWMQSDYLGYRGFMTYGGLSGVNDNVSTNDAVERAVAIQAQLAEFWNYSFTICENTTAYESGSPELDFNAGFINKANSYPNDSPIKFSLKTFRLQLPTLANPGGSGSKAAVAYQYYFKPEDYYLMKYDGPTYPDDDNFLNLNGDENSSTKLWNPAAELATYNADGSYQKSILARLFGAGANSGTPPMLKNIYHISENNEYTPQFSIGSSGPDINIDNKFNAACGCIGGASIGHQYISTRKKDLDNNYRNQFFDPSTFGQLTDAMYLNYAVDGRDDYGQYFRYKYDIMRETNSEIGSTGQYLSTPDFYPQNPSNWNPTVGDRHGIQWMNEARIVELASDDNRYAPYVSAGWEHYEEKNIRPAQWLGLLKAVGIMGVDLFHSAFFNLGKIKTPEPNSVSWWQHPKGFVWQASTPAYVQGVFSRAEDLFTNGVLLQGDINLVVTSPSSGLSYKFKDSPNSLIMVRGDDLSAPTKLLLTGSIQPISNVQGNAVDDKIATITAPSSIGNLKFEIRRQGSTYLYDHNGGTPIFYQLDKWHESTHPDHWTKDFYFEAELIDNNPSTMDVYTVDLSDTPITNGDYSLGYDTYVTTSNEALEYRFTPRDNTILTVPHDNDYVLYVRAKLLTGSSGSIGVQLNASDHSQTFSTNLGCLSGTDWDWYRVCSSGATFENLNPNIEFSLALTPSGSNVAIDAIYLDVESDNMHFPIDLSVITSIECIDPVGSISSTLLCSGNRDLTASGSDCSATGTTYLWSTSQTTATITDKAPGTYTVTITEAGMITASATITFGATPTLTVVATERQKECTGSPGSRGQAQVLVEGGSAPYTYLWSDGLSQTTPTASGLTAGNYTVTVTDANSCTQTDLVTIASVAPDQVAVTPSTATINFAQETQIDADAGFASYQWSPEYWIDNPYIEDPKVRPEANQIYTVTAIDGNGCTSQATVNLTVTGSNCGTYTNNFSVTEGVITGGKYNLNSSFDLTDHLTINNAVIAIASAVEIDTKGYTLTINNCELFACSDMWGGIYQFDPDGKIIITNSNIKDAETAVSAEDGTVEVNGTIFNHNFTSIKLSSHDFSVSGTDNTFYGNKFKNSNSEISKAPHIGQDPDQHILITDVDEVEIGISNSAIDPNVFSNSLVGIKSLNSNTVVLNNDFRNIGDNNFQERYSQINFIVPPNAALWSQGVGSGPSGSISVGDDTDDGKNTFSDCESGIYATINTQVGVTKNNFSNTMIGIRLEQLQDNGVSIQRNVMDDFIDGISLFNVSGNKSVEIKENDLNMNQIFDEEEFEYVSTEYSINGISLDASAPTLLDYTIRDNEIQNCRFGISLNGIAPGSRFYPSTINIYYNDIKFYIQRADLSSNENYGIWLQNTRRAYIYGNTISWFHEPLTGDEELISGITLSNSTANEIGDNEIISMGSGINIMGDCSRSHFYCNEFRNNFHGVFLNGNGVNSRITRQGNAEIFTNYLQAWKNEWIDNVDADEIAGNSNFGADWFYDSNGGANLEFVPTSGVTAVAPFSVDESILGCYSPTYYELISMRTADFGIKDSMFDHPDSVLIAYFNNETFYLLSNLDTTILYTGNSVDSIYINAFDTLQTNNIGRLNNVLTMIIARDLVSAQDTLDVIIPINAPEENMIFVLNTYLKYLNETIEEEDIDELRILAYEHPFYEGRAVYMARALLNIKVIDYLEGLRIGNTSFSTSTNPKEKEKFTQIYPNPNRGELIVRVLNRDAFRECNIVVYDLTGRILMRTATYDPITNLKMPNLQPGSYLIEIASGDSFRDIHKFEIIH
ncbi:MAG: T9SS type A sorting domain-containing protein [Bacteroidia bacterium]|nr:T9SS type A sorting domain-containing protein [Bacteroidia bacterium]